MENFITIHPLRFHSPLISLLLLFDGSVDSNLDRWIWYRECVGFSYSGWVSRESMNETLLEGFAVAKVFSIKTWMDTKFHQTDIIKRLKEDCIGVFPWQGSWNDFEYFLETWMKPNNSRGKWHFLASIDHEGLFQLKNVTFANSCVTYETMCSSLS